MVIRIGFEPMTYCLEGSCSIQLSYRTEWAANVHFFILQRLPLPRNSLNWAKNQPHEKVFTPSCL